MSTFPLRVYLCMLVVVLTTACSASNPTSSKRASNSNRVALDGSHSYRVQASRTTTSALGVKDWHLLTEPATTSLVLEGVDAQGEVAFASTFREHDGQLDIRSYRGVRGEMTLARSGDKTTIDGNLAVSAWRKYMRAYVTDSANGRAKVEYAAGHASKETAFVFETKGGNYCFICWNFEYNGSKPLYCVVCWNGQPRAENPASSFANSAASVVKNSEEASPENADKSENPDDEDNSGPNGDSTDPDADSDANTDANDGSEDAPDDSDDTTDAQDDGSGAESQSEGDVSADSSDDALDSSYEGDDSSYEGDDGSYEGDDSSYDDSGDDGSYDDSSDDGSYDDSGDDSEYAARPHCRHLSCSASTKICICAKY